MSARATNHAILFLLSVELLSGLTSFSIGRPGGSWIFWLHGIAGFSLVGLVIWKYRIIFRSFRRRGVASETVGSIILVLLFVGVLASGTLWAIIGRGSVEIPFYGNARLWSSTPRWSGADNSADRSRGDALAETGEAHGLHRSTCGAEVASRWSGRTGPVAGGIGRGTCGRQASTIHWFARGGQRSG